MLTSDFSYILPPERIAQQPVNPRDHSKLLVLHRDTKTWEHKQFFEIGDFLKPGDLLVVNESKVFKARLYGTHPLQLPLRKGEGQSHDGRVDPPPYEEPALSEAERSRMGGARGSLSGRSVEIFLLRPQGPYWLALANPGKKLAIGSEVCFEDGSTCRVQEKHEDGTIVLDFGRSAEDVFALAEKLGAIPTPPYVEQGVDEQAYQTVYAKTVGSVAAPTAGFHFTPELIDSLKSQGIRFATVTLHVGLGTFRPMKTETIEEHTMHEEWIDVPDETINAIEETKKNGGRVIAVGTTSVRALESGVRHGFTNIFITPGFQFKVIDGMITNFHLPKSTLLVLVSSFAGREFILSAYEEAIKENYRFYSFGDAMLIV